MFLCEVGMNNTLVGLLHPQADEKMFNFSKCSTPAPFLSFIFPLWLFERLSGVFVSFRESGVDLLFSCLQWAQSARSASQTKGSICICKHKRINRQNELGVVPLSDAARVLQLYNLVGRLFYGLFHPLAITEETNPPPLLIRTSILFISLAVFQTGDMWQLLWLTQPGATRLVNEANYGRRQPDDGDD